MGVATLDAWRTQLGQLVALMLAACAVASLIELVLAAGGYPVPLVRAQLTRLAALPVLVGCVLLGRKLPVRDVAALAWMACVVGAAAHGKAASAVDAAIGTTLLGTLGPLLVACTGWLPAEPRITLRLSLTTACSFMMAYVVALPIRSTGAVLLTAVLVTTALSPLAAVALSVNGTRVRARRRGAVRRIQRLRTRLRQAEDARTRFLNGLARTLHAPLASVVGLSDRLAREPLSPDAACRLAMLRTQAEAALAHLAGSLEEQGLDDGDAGRERITFDLHALLDAVAGQHRPLAHRRGVELAVHRLHSLPRWVIGDPARVRHVISSLMEEAIGRTWSGSVTLHATDEERTWDDRVRVRLVVQDTGAGLLPDDERQALATNDSSQPHAADAPPPLRCRAVVDRLGGTTGCESQPGWGTVTWCTVPLEIDVAAEQLGMQGLGVCGAVNGHRPTALVIEGDDVQRELLLDLLDDRGWSGARAESTTRARDVAQRLRLDLVLLATAQPDDVLAELVAAVRERGGESPPIVALGSGDGERDRRLVHWLGLAGRLPRPVRAEAMGALLRRHHPRIPETAGAASPC